MVMNTAAVERIAKVDVLHARAMLDNPTTFEAQQLPFYGHFKVLRATVTVDPHPLELRYADDGIDVLPLSARQHIYQINRREGLQLTAEEVPAYMRFFLEMTSAGKRQVVERFEEIQWLGDEFGDSFIHLMKEKAKRKVRPMRVTAVGAESFRVLVSVLHGRALLEVSVKVFPDGEVFTERETLVVDWLPVAVSP
jgi:hypothetical protein